MICDPARLREVLEEISAWSLQARREYIASIEIVFGPAASEQIKQGLRALWEQRKANA